MVVASAKESGLSYFKKISDLLVNTRVTDRSGALVPLQQGLDRAVDMLLAVRASGKKVMFAGNGGSSTIASHQAIDFWKAGGLPALAFNDSAQLTCLSNDFGYEFVFSKAVEMFGQEGDLLIAISSGGKSPNILNAAAMAQEKGCSVLTFAGFNQQAPLLSLGDLNFYIDSDRYGFVEIGHLAIIHYFTDYLCANR